MTSASSQPPTAVLSCKRCGRALTVKSRGPLLDSLRDQAFDVIDAALEAFNDRDLEADLPSLLKRAWQQAKQDFEAEQRAIAQERAKEQAEVVKLQKAEAKELTAAAKAQAQAEAAVAKAHAQAEAAAKAAAKAQERAASEARKEEERQAAEARRADERKAKAEVEAQKKEEKKERRLSQARWLLMASDGF